MPSTSASHSRSSFRPFLERACLRHYVAELEIDERPIARAVKPLLKEGDVEMRKMRQKGVQYNEAMLQCSRVFSDKMVSILNDHCAKALNPPHVAAPVVSRFRPPSPEHVL